MQRGDAQDFTGTTQGLWAIAVAVYLSLLGPHGLRGARRGAPAAHALRRAAARRGRRAARRRALAARAFKEFVVGFDDTGRAVADVNARLREQGIFGGLDLSRDFPELGQSALYSVTEQHTQADIDRLVDALAAATA